MDLFEFEIVFPLSKAPVSKNIDPVDKPDI
jgi:hypothetical protein